MRLIRSTTLGGVILTLLTPVSAWAATFYVAPNGNDANPGTMVAPFATIARGQVAALGGDTVYLRGGIYSFITTTTACALPTDLVAGVVLDKSGSVSGRISYLAFPGELPIFDFAILTATCRIIGVRVTGSFISLKGIEIRNVPQDQGVLNPSWGLHNSGSSNLFEALNIHHNAGPGLAIVSGGLNLILNCDAHHNYDSLNFGATGDGFRCSSAGAGAAGNIFRRCRAWSNSDDGFDLTQAQEVVTIEGSWAWKNGYIPDTTQAGGSGSGFKAGGFGSPPLNPPAVIPRHSVRQNVAFGNRTTGFYANHHPGGIDFFNNTAFQAVGINYDMLADAAFPSNHTLRNNIAMGAPAISNLTGGTDTFNSWSLAVTVSAADFLSMEETDALAARASDGSLPINNFVRLVPGSDLIDRGQDVGLPFNGPLPDLGAFESTAVTGTGGSGMGGSIGTGGVTGTGGRTGTGGTVGTGGMLGSGGSIGTGGRGGNSGAGGLATGTGGTTGNGGISGTAGTTGSAGVGGSLADAGSNDRPTDAAGNDGGTGGSPGGGGGDGGDHGQPTVGFYEKTACAYAGSGGGGADLPVGALAAGVYLIIARARRRRGRS